MKFYQEQIESISNVLKDLIYTEKNQIPEVECVKCGYKTSNTPPETGWEKISTNGFFQGKDQHYWFKFHIDTPKADDKHKRIELNISTGREGQWDGSNPQALIYLNGVMTQGMDVNHTFVALEFDKSYDILVYFYLGMIEERVYFEPTVRIYDERIEKLWYDITVPMSAAKIFDVEKDEYIQPVRELTIATNYLDLRKPYSKEFYESLEKCSDYLQENYYNRLCGGKNHTVNLVGHTHIDVAWLWTLAQTVEKSQRSFATVINLMKQYPEYRFMSSQPQLYEYVKQEAPELYEEIKKAIKDGRWEAEGAMWLEADCNLSSGESLVRQIMFGKRFFKKEFNVDNKVVWLPDVFGYSAAMPQIMKKSGVDKFVTSKISWNDRDRMPHETFMWEGIDGTEIFTSFMTAQDINNDAAPSHNYATYVGYVRPTQVYGSYKRNSDKHYINDSMITFGFGDGGGGPTKDMLEQARRLEKGLPGLPATKIVNPTDYLNKLEKDFINSCKLHRFTPKWTGELYLEYHRGTYTSMAKNKKYNRKSEILLQSTEAVSAIAKNLLNKEYEQDILNKNWKVVLLNQFHDIIPGSSIKEVYDDSHAQYEELLKEVSSVKADTLKAIAQQIETDGGILVYNPCSFTVTEPVKVGDKYILAENIPAFGWKVIKDTNPVSSIVVGDKMMENDFVKVIFDKNYNITSVYDKANNREVLIEGEKANHLQVFEDRPHKYDAWELGIYHEKKMWTIDDVKAVTTFEEGAKAGFEITRQYNNSTITQKISLTSSSAQIEFDTKVDWQEDHVILKTAFPLDIHTNTATYDIQFGNVERPVTRNTSWEEAKYEVCAHKWADLSEADYGVALLNDCKYGHSVDGSTLRLSLLKAPTYPNPVADRGEHQFKYALYPHKGALADSDVITQAYKFNSDFDVCEIGSTQGTLPSEYSFISCDNDDIIIETVKKAEDSDGTVIRMYASKNKRAKATIKAGFEIKESYLCDMMENIINKLEIKNNQLHFSFKPYEIITLILK